MPAGDGPESPAIRAVAPPSIAGYQVRRVIALGGFGIVFEGEREIDGTTVAIKIPREDRSRWGESPHEPRPGRGCLDREIRALSRIGPPHVPRVHAHGVTETGTPYLVMEYLTAPTLAERLVDRPVPLSVVEAVALTRSLLDAVAGVHAAGYVNRDIKPENVFVGDDGRVTLVDLGLARRVDVRGSGSASGPAPRAPVDVRGSGSASGPAPRAPVDATLEGEGFGTAEYMAPEQCDGALDVDCGADLYAVGVILFELLAGRPPFWGPRTVVEESHLSRRPPRVSALAEGRAIPTAIEDVVARCLAKDRGERFRAAADVQRALDAALGEPRSAMGAPPPGPRAAPTAARSATPVPSPSPQTRSASRSERVTAGLLFFETSLDVASVKERVASLGGCVGQATGGRCVAVFTDDVADNPAHRAQRAAEELIRLGIAERARIDLAPVAVRTRRDGARLFFSPLFSRAALFPGSGEPEGILVTPAAAAVLPESALDAPLLPVPPGAGATPQPLDVEALPLVGREALLASLIESARRAGVEPTPTIVSVVGEAGLGKTRLCGALSGQLGALGPFVRVLSLRAREPALGGTDPTLAELLRRVLDLPDAVPEGGGEALLRERLGPHGSAVPAVALALGWIADGAGDSPLRATLEAQVAAPGALRSALIVATGEALRRLSTERALIVVIDDAHFAGDVFLSALEYAARAEARAPLWICALGRPRLVHEQPTWGQEAGRRERVELGPLDFEDAARLCRWLLRPVESAPSSVVERLVARTQGNPLLLVELVRGLHREGIVRKSPKGEAYYLATDELDRLPSLPRVEWLARREVDALTPALRGHARLVALLGEQVSIDEIAGVLRRLEWQGIDKDLPLDAKIATRRLLAARLIVMDSAGRVSFRHGLVREAIAQAIPYDPRRLMHAAAAEYYTGDDAAGLDEERRLAQLAYHAGEARLADEAARSYLALAARAEARHAYADAELLYSRALSQPADAAAIDRRAAYRSRGLMRYRMARYHDALTDFSCAGALCAEDRDVADRIGILLDEATALDWMDAYELSEERVEEARALIRRASSPLLEARLLLGLGRSAFRFSRNEEAAGLLERAAALAERLGEEGYETRIIALMQLGFLLPGLGRHEDARRALDRIVALGEERGDRLHLACALNVRGLLFATLGDKDRFLADMDRSLAIARELGQATLELMGEFNLAEFLLLMDDAGAAAPHVHRAEMLDRRISGGAGRPDVALLAARLHLYCGEHGRAAEIVARLRARQDEARGPGQPLLVPSHEVLCGMIELSLRGADEAAWDALEDAAARFCTAQERIEVIEARGGAALRAGRPAEAWACFERARALAMEAPNAMRGRISRRLSELDRGYSLGESLV